MALPMAMALVFALGLELEPGLELEIADVAEVGAAAAAVGTKVGECKAREGRLKAVLVITVLLAVSIS